MADETTEPRPEETEEPQVFAVSGDVNEVKFTRRGFLELAAAASSALALTGCDDSASTPARTATVAPTPMRPTISNTKVPTPTKTKEPPTPTPSPQAVVQVSSANLRTGPGTEYEVVLVVLQGEVLTVTARLADGNWLKVITAAGDVGWIALSVVELNVDVNVIAVENDIPAPPQPTEPPGVRGTVPPGQEGINYTVGGETYTLPCGSPIPADAVCVCNCVTVPAVSCGCDQVCTCDTVCTCVGASHYWYPN